jgi:hypothetical protein
MRFVFYCAVFTCMFLVLFTSPEFDEVNTCANRAVKRKLHLSEGASRNLKFLTDNISD